MYVTINIHGQLDILGHSWTNLHLAVNALTPYMGILACIYMEKTCLEYYSGMLVQPMFISVPSMSFLYLPLSIVILGRLICNILDM